MAAEADLQVVVTDAWRATFPEARAGMLLLDGVTNEPAPRALQIEVHRIEAELRERFRAGDRATLEALPTIQAYQRHYRAFGQTYHVLRQLISVAIRGEALSNPSALVQAMFAAELRTQLLTAGHDADAVQWPVTLDVSRVGDAFVGLGGKQHVLRPGDMLMRDAAGIISAVIYGPDDRTRLVDHTRRALFTTYAPAGIGVPQVLEHLEQLAGFVGVVAPEAQVNVWLLDPTSG